MTRIQPKTILIVMVLALALAALLAPAAMAAPPTADGAAFGNHVSTMAKMGHLGKDCNPGKHKGITGWHKGDMMPCMPMPMTAA
ncbi:MAG TPA: hypothetical protein VFE20_04045 [Thermoleophilia bacterium]|nr:hypothetical protein [Thermoleophilia bacterium]